MLTAPLSLVISLIWTASPLLDPPAAGAAQEVYILEFSLRSPFEADRGLELRLQRQIEETLKVSGHFANVQVMKPELWSDVSREMQKRVDHTIITGELLCSGEDKTLEVAVRVDQHVAATGETETQGWKNTVPKELSSLERYFERVSQRVVAELVHLPFRKIIFTSCFEVRHAEGDPDLERLSLRMPVRLRTALQDLELGDKYDLISFKTREVEEQCLKRAAERLGREAEYLVYGFIWPDSEGQLRFDVLVERLEADDEKPFESISYEKSNPAILKLLAEHIDLQWEKNNVEVEE